MKTPLYLLKDIVIPAGTKFETAPTHTFREGEGHVSHIIGLSKDTSGEVVYFVGDEGSEERKQLEEMFSTQPLPQPTPPGGLSIGEAVTAMKQGKRVAREGWNGKGMHVYLEDMWAFPIRDGIYKGQKRKYAPVMVLYIGAADLHQPGWNASTPDLLANDWLIIE